MDAELVDRIYESLVIPELWPGVLDELGRLVDGNGGSIFITKTDVQFWTASPLTRRRAEAIAFVPQQWFWRGQITARLFGARHAGFLTDVDIFTPDELDREPVYRDVWRPLGTGWSVGTALPIPTGEYVTFVLTRRTERGPVECEFVQKLDALRPHLARSVLLSARFQLDRARMASETLAALGLPALVLSEQGKVLAANCLIEALTGYVQWRAQDRVSLKDHAADELLRDAIAAIVAIALRSHTGRGARCPQPRLRQNFGRHCHGWGVSRETIRTQLRRVMEKTAATGRWTSSRFSPPFPRRGCRTRPDARVNSTDRKNLARLT
jgi:hypothetical protein